MVGTFFFFLLLCFREGSQTRTRMTMYPDEKTVARGEVSNHQPACLSCCSAYCKGFQAIPLIVRPQTGLKRNCLGPKYVF